MSALDRPRRTASLEPGGAEWVLRRPRLVALLLSLVPVAFASIGFGAAQALQLPERTGLLVTGATMVLGGLVGLAVMIFTRPTMADFGLRRPTATRSLLGFAPLIAAVVLVFISGGVSIASALVPAYALVALGAALNEEVWFRGLVLAALRPHGARYAVIGQAILFGVLHLANLAGGKSPTYAALQLTFALLFGLVAGLVVVFSRSLWPAMAWHFAHDLVSYLGGDVVTTRTLIGLGLAVVVLAGYAAYLWRQLPADQTSQPA